MTHFPFNSVVSKRGFITQLRLLLALHYLCLAQTLPSRPILEQYKQLVFSLDALLDLVQQRSLATLILTRHLGDLLAALIQVPPPPFPFFSNADPDPAAFSMRFRFQIKKSKKYSTLCSF